MDASSRRARILLADDHALVLEGLRGVLEANYEVVGAVEDGYALLAEAERLKPDVVLLDITMPLLNGIEAARELRRRAPDTRIIFVTMHSDATFARQAFAAGALGYVVKRSASRELIHAIEEALRGRRYISSYVSAGLGEPLDVGAPLPGSLGRLTPRQRQVLQQVAEGHSAKQIAAQLNVCTKTVEYHKKGIMQALGLRSTAELVRYAVKHGLVSA